MNWLILPSIIGSFLCLNCKAGFKAGYSSLNITRCRPVPILPNLTWPQRSRAFIGRYISHNANNIYISLELILVAECLNEIISKQHSRSPPPQNLNGASFTAIVEKYLPEYQAVIEEPVVWIALITSLLLGIANPALSRAVVSHSKVFHSPVSRLGETMTWIYLMHFGYS